MTRRAYYSVRTGKNPNAGKLELPILIRLFCDVYKILEDEGYFQEAFGYCCIDAGDVPGTLGTDIEAQILIHLRKTDLWPIHEKGLGYSEDDLFDLIEFLYDYVSQPVDGYFHSYGECGWHYKTFDQDAGRRKFREEVNNILTDYKSGYELSEQGEILALADPGMSYLFDAELPQYDPKNVERRVNEAILKFRRHKSTYDERRDAIRDLADVLEFLRPKLKEVLHSKDESDLFNIVNNFGIRHHNERQKTDYDEAIWYSWMFYYYLATIQAAVRLIHKADEADG
jgi:hypothetical protein